MDLITLFCVLSFFYQVGSASQNVTDRGRNEEKLLNTLFIHYVPDVLPYENVNLTFGLTLVAFNELNEFKEYLDVNCHMIHQWTDSRLKWNASKYGGVSRLTLSLDTIWRPDISLYNGYEEMNTYYDKNVVVFNDGGVYYIPSVRLKGQCSVDLRYFPFDKQTCTFMFGSWIHTGEQIDIHLQYDSDNSFYNELESNPKGWKVLKTSAIREEKIYPCCPEMYPSLKFTAVLQRNSIYYLHVYVIPAILLSLLVPFSFLLPANSKERLTLGVGLVITNVIMMLRLQDVLPTQHITMPAIGTFYSLNVTWSILVVLATIFVLNVHNRGPRQIRVPDIIRLIFLRSLKRIVCLQDDSYYPFNSTDSISMRGLENPCVPSSPGDTFKNKEAKKDTFLENEVEYIGKQINMLTAKSNLQEGRYEIRNEWYQVALVIDRILFFFFFLTYLIYTVVLLA